MGYIIHKEFLNFNGISPYKHKFSSQLFVDFYQHFVVFFIPSPSLREKNIASAPAISSSCQNFCLEEEYFFTEAKSIVIMHTSLKVFFILHSRNYL